MNEIGQRRSIGVSPLWVLFVALSVAFDTSCGGGDSPSDLDGATVGAAIDRGGLYRVLLGEASSTALDYTRLLDQNVPNPFNPSTLIRFRVPQDGPVSLRIYDVQGRLVRTLVHGHHEAGEDAALWNGADDAGHAAAGGVYFYRLESGERTEARKMVLIK